MGAQDKIQARGKRKYGIVWAQPRAWFGILMEIRTWFPSQYLMELFSGRFLRLKIHILQHFPPEFLCFEPSAHSLCCGGSCTWQGMDKHGWNCGIVGLERFGGDIGWDVLEGSMSIRTGCSGEIPTFPATQESSKSSRDVWVWEGP